MGLSSNQARFLSLTSRQVDLEQRVQQICQRRLRLSSELEKVATQYNDSISNRKMFVPQPSGIQNLSLESISSLGLKVMNSRTNAPVQFASGVTQITEAQALAMGYDAAHIIHDAAEFTSKISTDLAGNYIMVGDVDMSSLGTLANSAITGAFAGQLDGNGYAVQNLSIDTGGAAINNVGLFSNLAAGSIVKNLAVENISINATSSNRVGALAGIVSGGASIENSYTSGSVLGVSKVGGFVGYAINGSAISYSSSSTNVTGLDDEVGGFVGDNRATIKESYATGNVSGDDDIGGFVGINSVGSISNSYASGNVVATNGSAGGFAGNAYSGNITYSYATGNVSEIGAGYVGGFAGDVVPSGNINATNFYKNNLSLGASLVTGTFAAVDANVNPMPTDTWDTDLWDLNGSLPALRNAAPLIPNKNIEEALRSGEYYLVSEANEFTQSPIDFNGETYEEIDWRTVPGLNDELFKGGDVDAEDKYDRTIAQINSQDKKLQLEQSSVEVEYKAISSEKEAVKKILDANSSSSFKYFS